MKKIVAYLLLIPIFLVGCEKDEITDNEESGIGCDFPIVDVIVSESPMVKIEYNSNKIYVQEFNGVYILEGDILIRKDEENLSKSVGRTNKHWTNNEMFFTIDPNIKDKQRIYDAMSHWESKTNITFTERTTEANYVYFEYSTGGCASYVGMIGGMQKVWTSDACSTGNIIHEIGHAAGLFHEQSRIDRDDYIMILWDNIISGREHNFEKANAMTSYVADLSTYLDFNSIMMYPSYAFSNNGQPTIVKLDGTTFSIQRSFLSVGDIYGINILYPSDTTDQDSDGDGVLDKNDLCPDVMGPIENNGCPWPDTDGDGVIDKDDLCPNEVGPISNNGCPIIDTDGDGIPDEIDQCPYEVGDIIYDGCPETIEYVNGQYYMIAGELVFRNNDKWYIKKGKNWKEVQLIDGKWEIVGGNKPRRGRK